eukprot:3196538-Karenia_brevis.AAC.1
MKTLGLLSSSARAGHRNPLQFVNRTAGNVQLLAGLLVVMNAPKRTVSLEPTASTTHMNVGPMST